MKKHQYFLWFLFLFGCENPENFTGYEYGDEIELKLGEEVTISEDGTSLRFIDVTGDSRCPKAVNCVWAGNGEIEIEFYKETLRLNTTLNPQEVNISGYTVRLISLLPYPEYQRDIEKEEYRAVLTVLNSK